MIFVHIMLMLSLLGSIFGAVYAFEEYADKLGYSYCLVGITVTIAWATLAVFVR